MDMGAGGESLVPVCSRAVDRDDRGDTGDNKVRKWIRAGGARYPENRKAFVLEDTKAVILVTEREAVGEMGRMEVKVRYVDEEKERKGVRGEKRIRRERWKRRVCVM
jgi:hypothetical protein